MEFRPDVESPSLRNEVAVTLYDAQWRPIHYETHGEENAGVKLDYHITARIGGEKIRVATHRDALPELKTSAAYQGALACSEIPSIQKRRRRKRMARSAQARAGRRR